MPSQELYKTDLERRLYGEEPERSGGSGLRRTASLLGVLTGLGLAYWLYRRVRDRSRHDRWPEFPEDNGSELAA